ncbi:MAG TPA: DPP IV N-terminal domain-containing protein [Bryobacteraceae bacterium]|nr:DPP IV N-terminal domain-containing protein [Bryobacteraceae bacterium]
MKLFLPLLPSLLLSAADTKTEPVKVQKANYELAQRWTTTKIGKLVFDTQVTPHWIEGDRFWYSYETSHGRRFMLVDPVKKTKAPLFDVSKMAAMLTLITRTPYDAQHLPIRTIKFAKNDTVIQFEVQVDKDADINGTQKVIGVEEEGDMTQTTGSGNPQGRGGRGAAPPNPRKRTLYFEYELASGKLTLPPEFTPEPRKPAWASMSPDEKTIVFARKNNLWMMDMENYAKALKKSDDSSIKETQLTTDGEDGFSYARHISGAERDQEQQQQQESGQAAAARDKTGRVPPIVVAWSKDSKKFSVVRRDERKVGDLWVIHTLESPRPTLETYKYAMPGDVNVPLPHLEVFDLAAKSRKEMKIDRFKDQFARVLTAPVTARQREKQRTDPQWLADGSDKLYFERQSRDLHKLDICIANPETGEVTTLIEDRMNTYIESKPLRLVNNGEELLYWSERDGWGHWYLYDGKGGLKSQVTSGEFVTEAIDNIDEKARTMIFTAEGREPGENPYLTHAYSIKLDGAGMKMLDPGDASHTVAMADDGKYFVDNSSRVNTAPRSVLYDRAGAQILDLETTDVSALVDTGFKMPEPFSVKADDGLTDLYGVMYKPFDFDPNKKYPIIAYVYPGPQTESVTQVFTPKSPNVGLAQLGFIVIEVGNRGGNPHRSKWYHTFGYGNLRDYGLADKKAAIEQLARRYSFIDIERVGITGHSGGGFMSAAAMLQYPDFFKVAVSESGNHENNVYNQTWSEKHHGIKEVVNEKDGSVHFEYNIEKNSEIAKNLKGHLMLTTGDMDDNVHMANTMRLADALIKANKRFDQFILPGIRHSYAAEANYFFWVRADYFCRFLLGDWDQRVDMTEMEAEASPRPVPGARRGAEDDQNP